MKILLIEDELLIRKSLEKMLKKKGADVTSIDNGQDAIKLILNDNYDRIVCDLMLKDINGFDIIEDSKTKYSIEEIGKKFIIITAYSSLQIIEKAKSYNCIVIQKPFENIDEVLNLFLRED